MIEQDIGLDFLIPLAIEELEKNILAGGECYSGDLLCNVLNSDKDYWNRNKGSWKKICELFHENLSLLKTFDTTWQIRKDMFNRYKEFLKIN